jgi:hypothetical protein
VDLNAEFKGGDYTCISSYATGAVNFINASIYFARSSNPIVLSDSTSSLTLVLLLLLCPMLRSTDIAEDNLHFMTVIKYDGAEAGDCIQVGGGTERCNHLYAWPTEWTSGAVVGQTYTALVNVTDAKYTWAPGMYTVRFALFPSSALFLIVIVIF